MSFTEDLLLNGAASVAQKLFCLLLTMASIVWYGYDRYSVHSLFVACNSINTVLLLLQETRLYHHSSTVSSSRTTAFVFSGGHQFSEL